MLAAAAAGSTVALHRTVPASAARALALPLWRLGALALWRARLLLRHLHHYKRLARSSEHVFFCPLAHCCRARCRERGCISQ